MGFRWLLYDFVGSSCDLVWYYFIKIVTNTSAVSSTDGMVDTQLWKLRDMSGSFVVHFTYGVMNFIVILSQFRVNSSHFVRFRWHLVWFCVICCDVIMILFWFHVIFCDFVWFLYYFVFAGVPCILWFHVIWIDFAWFSVTLFDFVGALCIFMWFWVM